MVVSSELFEERKRNYDTKEQGLAPGRDSEMQNTQKYAGSEQFVQGLKTVTVRRLHTTMRYAAG